MPRGRRACGLARFAVRAARAAKAGRRRGGRLKAFSRRILGGWYRRAEHRPPCLDGLWPLRRRKGKAAVDRREKRGIVVIGVRHAQRPVGILADAARSIGRREAGNGVMQNGGRRIDVAPRTLLAVERVLLDGCVLRGENAGERTRAAPHRLARGAEVDQDRHAVGPDDDVRWLDVAMEKALGVNGVQAAQQPLRQASHLAGLQAVIGRAQELCHAATVLEFHDSVGRVVGFEVTQHRDDMKVAKAGERTRLVEKALAAPGEIVGDARRARRNVAVGPTHCKFDGEVLLDGDTLGELGVEGAIGNAESAMADDRVEAIVTEPRRERQSLIVFG